jgi:hypothetical protein
VKLHSVFLRDDCTLPSCVNPLRNDVGEHWTYVQDISSPVFDIMIRQAGWHYIWMLGCCSRRGCARTQEAATENALGRALKAIAGHSNAAELDSVQITSFAWFHIANVTVQRRRIQEHSSLDTQGEDLRQASSSPNSNG